MIFNRLIIASALSLIALTACSTDDTTDTVVTGENTTTYVSSDSGTHSFDIKSNSAWSAKIADSQTKRWVEIKSNPQGEGNSSLEVYYRANTSFSREGRIIVKTSTTAVADTIIIRQYGITPVIEFTQKSLTVAAMGNTLKLPIASNLNETMKERVNISYQTVSGTESDWLSERALNATIDTLNCTVAANRDVDRTAKLIINYTDDWGLKYTSECHLSQVSLGGTANTKTLSFTEVRALAASDSAPTDITGDVAVAGIVVSDNSSDNIAENPNTSQTSIDFTKNYRTVYIESTDGKYGLAMVLDNKADNTFRRYDKVTIWLKDTKIEKSSAPVCYTITNLSSKAIVNIESGTAADLPSKEKSIAELTADDIFTFVTLKDCEFPVKKGSFTPINEGYCSAYNVGRVDKYALTVRDKAGSHIFMMTNISTSYRRDGNAVPAGAGSLSGIIVHEAYSRFEKDGNIGDFQIRPIFRDDIKVETALAKAYSKVLVEWNALVKSGNYLTATTGTGTMSHSSTSYTATAYATTDFSFLGPIIGDGTDGKGAVSSSANQAWANAYWWDSANNCGESWVAEFSTAGLTGKHLFMSMAAMNNAIGAPRYWDVEWSTTNDKLGTWNKVGSYTIPDPVYWSNTLYTQLSGWKNISMELPAAMLGLDKVYLRLKVSQNKAGTTTAYDSTKIVAAKASALSYLSIQYND